MSTPSKPPKKPESPNDSNLQYKYTFGKPIFPIEERYVKQAAEQTKRISDLEADLTKKDAALSQRDAAISQSNEHIRVLEAELSKLAEENEALRKALKLAEENQALHKALKDNSENFRVLRKGQAQVIHAMGGMTNAMGDMTNNFNRGVDGINRNLYRSVDLINYQLNNVFAMMSTDPLPPPSILAAPITNTPNANQQNQQNQQSSTSNSNPAAYGTATTSSSSSKSQITNQYDIHKSSTTHPPKKAEDKPKSGPSHRPNPFNQ